MPPRRRAHEVSWYSERAESWTKTSRTGSADEEESDSVMWKIALGQDSEFVIAMRD